MVIGRGNSDVEPMAMPLTGWRVRWTATRGTLFLAEVELDREHVEDLRDERSDVARDR